MWIDFASGHWMNLGAHKSISMALYSWVNTEGEDVLMMGCEDARMDNIAPWNGDTLIYRLRADNPCGPYLISDFAGLVEDEGKYVFVIGHSNDGLNYELPLTNDGCTLGAVVGVLPKNASILFMNTDGIWSRLRISSVVCHYSIHIMNRPKAVTAKFEIICHNPSTDIAEIEG